MSFMPETTTAPVTRQTEVEQEFVRVDETVGYIDKMMGELEERLVRSILAQRNEGQAEGGSPSNPEPVRVPLAQSLYDHGTRLERIRERLSSILSRLEA